MVWLRNVIGEWGIQVSLRSFQSTSSRRMTCMLQLGQKFDRHRMTTWQVGGIGYGYLWYQSWQSLSGSQANIIHMHTTSSCSLETNCVSQNSQRYFALCDSCFWSVSLLQSSSTLHCPVCPGQAKLSLIPLQLDECYDIKLNSKGLEMKFGKTAKRLRSRE